MPPIDPRDNGGRHPASHPALQGAGPGLGLDDLLPDTASDQSEALAELFLGEDPPAPPPASRPAPPSQAVRPLPLLSPAAAPAHAPRPAPPIEGLVLGHLPVLASAWVQQYARHIASEQRGPIALLRLRANEAVLELVSGNGIIHQPAEPNATSLADALAAASREAVSLLVRTDETTEPRLAELAGLDTLTLLSGADEAATVASYRTIKNLTARMDEETRQPSVRLAIMGATPAQASDAAARIERAASAFLDRQIHVSACISKIGGGKSTPLYKGPLPESVESVLRTLRQLFTPSARRAHAYPPPPPPIAAAPWAPAAVAPSIHKQDAAPVAADPVISRPSHFVNGQSPAPRNAPSPRLCDHVPGLTAAAIACPYSPDVEFALGTDGRLHLLTRLDDSRPQALPQLMTAASWATSHAGLLHQVLARDLVAQDLHAEPILHAFTSDAVSVRHLTVTPLRLHVLAQVRANGHATWFSTPLN